MSIHTYFKKAVSARIRRARRFGWLAAVVAVAALGWAVADAEVGREVALSRHLLDGEEHEVTVQALVTHGQEMFDAMWTPQEGGGRPLSTGTGADLRNPDDPLVFPRNFNRVSAPDANSCAGCHNRPFGISGGDGDIVANVFVLAQRFDFATFDGQPDESGNLLTLDSIANSRATTGMFGGGYLEMLARQMTAELQTIRNSIGHGQQAPLIAKGVSFGTLSRAIDGTWDVSAAEGLPAPALRTSGPGDPPSLVVHPWHQAAAVVSLRQFSNNALNHHHGIQPAERFGDGLDPDGDGFVDEATRADVTAMTVFQAVMAVPGRVIPRAREIEDAVLLGEQKFAQVGCNSCHVERLPLTDWGWHFFEPGPYNPPGNLQPHETEVLEVNLNSRVLPQPRLRAERGVTWVPAYTDMKLHDITSGPDDPNREVLNMHFAPGSTEFHAGNSRFLTKRLWGAGNTGPYFHHGKYTTIREAILAHAGEAQAVRDRYAALTEHERDCIVEFLKTLQVLPAGTGSPVIDEQGRARAWPPVR